MPRSEQKVVQYLGEARVQEHALTRVLESQIAMTPRGSYRSALEKHLRETRDHAGRVERRLVELDAGPGLVDRVITNAESVTGQVLALGKAPLELLRGTGGEERVLKNAKDAAATEALEIATYTALERLAQDVGDEETARLAASIREDEERMLERIRRELPRLTDAVVGAEVDGEPTYDPTTTGAADAARDARRAAGATARRTGTAARRRARAARAIPAVAEAEGRAKGAVASASDLAIAGYDDRTAEDVAARLSDLSQVDLMKIEAYERRHQDRATVRSRITALRADEPWPGYDELTAAEVQRELRGADADRLRTVRDYERTHKNRAGVLRAAGREHASPR